MRKLSDPVHGLFFQARRQQCMQYYKIVGLIVAVVVCILVYFLWGPLTAIFGDDGDNDDGGGDDGIGGT